MRRRLLGLLLCGPMGCLSTPVARPASPATAIPAPPQGQLEAARRDLQSTEARAAAAAQGGPANPQLAQYLSVTLQQLHVTTQQKEVAEADKEQAVAAHARMSHALERERRDAARQAAQAQQQVGRGGGGPRGLGWLAPGLHVVCCAYHAPPSLPAQPQPFPALLPLPPPALPCSASSWRRRAASSAACRGWSMTRPASWGSSTCSCRSCSRQEGLRVGVGLHVLPAAAPGLLATAARMLRSQLQGICTARPLHLAAAHTTSQQRHCSPLPPAPNRSF